MFAVTAQFYNVLVVTQPGNSPWPAVFFENAWEWPHLLEAAR